MKIWNTNNNETVKLIEALNAGISDISKPCFTSGGFRYNNENTNSGMAMETIATNMLSCFSFMNEFKRGKRKLYL